MSSFQEVFDMFSSARLPRMSRFMSRGGRTQRYSGGDGLAMPDADDEDVGPMGSDSPLRESRSVLGSIWWGMSSVALVAALMGAELPWWLLMVAGLEMCACAHGMYVHVHVRVHVHVHRMRTAHAPHVHRMCAACAPRVYCIHMHVSMPCRCPAAAPSLRRLWAAAAPSQPRRTRSSRLVHLGEVSDQRVHARQVRERAAGGRALGRRRRRQRSRAVGPRQHHDAGSQADLGSAGDVG